jgi:hypothetical protein
VVAVVGTTGISRPGLLVRLRFVPPRPRFRSGILRSGWIGWVGWVGWVGRVGWFGRFGSVGCMRRASGCEVIAL